MIASRLIAYAPNGARLGMLTDPAGWSTHLPLNDVSALTLDYFAHSEGAGFLAGAMEVALEASNGAAWVEPANARFLRLVRDRDQATRDGLWKFQMPGYAHLLGGMTVLAAKTPSEANTDKDGKRKFLSANAGTILTTIFNEARALDARILEGLTLDFTTSKDSSGANWSKIITIYYEVGLGFDTILSNLSAQGLVDWEMQGRSLRVFNADTTLARDKKSVKIHDRDSESAPIKATLEGLKHLVMLRGDDGKQWMKENVSTPTPWGKTITVINQGGVSDEGTANTLIQAELLAGSRERVQYTRALELAAGGAQPFADYRTGDYVTARDTSGTWAPLRVFALGLALKDKALGATLTLGDLFEDALIRQAKRTKGIVGGASSDGGSGTRPAPPEPGKRAPAAPAGLVMNSDHYFDARGVAHASVLASYAPATHGVDGLGLTIQAHELFGRQVGSTNPYRMLTSVEGSTATIGFSPLPVQTHWDFKVRAIAENGVPSAFSNVVRLELARDITPPSIPSVPILSTRLGTITIEWDGLTELGTPMEPDFDYVEVETTNHGGAGFVSAGQLRALTGSDFTVLADVPYRTATQVRFVAVDSSGNRSEPSEMATISTEPLVDADLIETTIFDAMTQLGTDLADGMTAVNQGIADVDDKVTTAQTTADGKNTVFRGAATPVVPTGGHKSADTWFEIAPDGSTVIKTWDGTSWIVQPLAADSIAANAITSVKIDAEAVTAVKIAARTITADRIAVNAITANEIKAFTITAGEIASRTITAVKLVANTITANEIAALTITANEIRANAVTTDKILAGSITTIKLEANAIDTTRLDAFAITSKHTITGATIQTTATPLRGVLMNSSGLFAYNTAGEQTVSIYSGSGNATLTGQLQTGLGDNQVVIRDNIFRGRPGMRLDTGSSDALQPTIQTMGTGANDGFSAGALVITGREATLNSSGRADLVLEHGGNFEFKQNWGEHSGSGIMKEGGYLYLRGVLHTANHSRDMFVTLQGNPATIGANSFVEWSWTYGQPAQYGTRKAIGGTTAGGVAKLSTNMAVMNASATTIKVWNLNTASQAGVSTHVIAYNSY